MDNNGFLSVVARSFLTGLTGSARSTAKLKILHGAIAQDLRERRRGITVKSLDEVAGKRQGKEATLLGAYYSKKVDIAASAPDDGGHSVAVGVKLVLNNYQQNGNNYFENMLGETANLRTATHPYAQVFIVPYRCPYFETSNGRTIKRIETFTAAQLEKYRKLSLGLPAVSSHIPDLILFYVVELPANPYMNPGATKRRYIEHFDNLGETRFSVSTRTVEAEGPMGPNFVMNDYTTFARRLIDMLDR